MKNTSSHIVDTTEIISVLKKSKCTKIEHIVPVNAKKKSNNIRGLFEGKTLHKNI